MSRPAASLTVSSPTSSSATSGTFRIGKVKGYRRGQIWYLCYHEGGQRRRPRVGSTRDEAERVAAEVNGQLSGGTPTSLGFEPVAVHELRRRWLEHHEHVRRSSVATVNRYRAATDHLLAFVRDVRPTAQAAHFTPAVAESFVRYLRTVEVSPNGHRNSQRRRLMDQGVKYVLHCCATLFNYAAKHRHLPPYSPNPFAALEIDRMPVEDAKPILLFDAEQERRFLHACDDWQFPVFLTLMLTGLRPGELCHLLAEDLQLAGDEPALRVVNRPRLGWQVKTRNERVIPLLPVLRGVLLHATGGRAGGPAFTRPGHRALENRTATELERSLSEMVDREQDRLGRALERKERLSVARSLWWEMGALREDRLRTEFIRVGANASLPPVTMPKVLRHGFATSLQDGNVDPLIRNQLMGHVPAQQRGAGGGLGMTAVYTHSRAETVRRQLTLALAPRAAAAAATAWLSKHHVTRTQTGQS